MEEIGSLASAGPELAAACPSTEHVLREHPEREEEQTLSVFLKLIRLFPSGAHGPNQDRFEPSAVLEQLVKMLMARILLS